MKFENTFAVDAPIDEVYTALLDVERVAPCVPGAEVLDQIGDDAYTVAIKVRVGPGDPRPGHGRRARGHEPRPGGRDDEGHDARRRPARGQRRGDGARRDPGRVGQDRLDLRA